jgi:6-phospho-3-hexuloisomerase
VRENVEEAEKHIIERITQTLEASNVKERDQFIEMILATDKIFIYGVGRSGLVAKSFAIRLVQLGLKVFFIGETVTPIVEPNDLVIIISNTGQTMSAVQTANIVRRVGATVVAITSRDHSKLAHAASIVIHLRTGMDEKDSDLSPLGTVFEDSTQVFLDGIVSVLAKKMNATESEMRARHSIWV